MARGANSLLRVRLVYESVKSRVILHPRKRVADKGPGTSTRVFGKARSRQEIKVSCLSVSCRWRPPCGGRALFDNGELKCLLSAWQPRPLTFRRLDP